MVVVQADLGLCQGYANCVDSDPDTFDLDDDGAVAIKLAEVDPARRDGVDQAVRSCPVSALRLVET